ncbi:MAG: hypothetical protein H6867_01635 [Rhodospirillales bacterium]|nr:hypothetical protein [Rhodospirillales bacterium]MCB9997219.1 hypothetical protein [Rhodospirillales bacterium]
MKNKKHFTALVAAMMLSVSAGVSSIPAYAQQTGGDKARLCKIYGIETVVPRGRDNVCAAPAYENDAGLCVQGSKAHNVFTYIQKEDGSLDFGLSYWFASGAHCGIIGNAKKTDKGWRYESNLDSANPLERCAVNISEQQEMIWFDADEDASCRMECGAQAHLRGTMLPLDTLDTRDVSYDDLNPETFFNTPCSR